MSGSAMAMRIARAVCLSEEFSCVHRTVHPGECGTCSGIAKAALTEARIPTPRMLKAACAAMSQGKRPTQKRVSVKAKHGIRYRAMIDAELSAQADEDVLIDSIEFDEQRLFILRNQQSQEMQRLASISSSDDEAGGGLPSHKTGTMGLSAKKLDKCRGSQPDLANSFLDRRKASG